MSNYSKTTDFEAKDSLPTGDSGKIIRGSEFETEFDAISTAIATKADTAGPTFTGTLTFETISDGTINVTAFVDEDNMASNSATLVPTQQSVKAYVDSQLTAQDLDFQADSGGALSIDLDSETMTFTGGTGIDTSGSGNAVTFAIDSTVATLTGSQTLTNKTLTSPDVNTPDIDGGTIDNTVIGGSTAAAGSFTTVSATGNITVGGTVDGRDVATDGSKLDGIEASATADQTASEIRTLVESASDSNVFTDADHSKLNGIEASADVTDATNVTAAGALMDSELTSIASVKALNQGVATSDSPTFAGLTTTANVSFGDNDRAVFGAGNDLEIYHTGSVSVIEDSGTGNLLIRGTDMRLQNAAGSNNYLKAVDGAEVSLFFAGGQKLATTGSGIDVTGVITTDGMTTSADINFGDNDKAIFGAGSDLQIFHDGTTSIIRDAGTGELQLHAENNLRLQNLTGSTYALFSNGAAAALYHNGSTKLATTSTGIDVTGTAVTDGLTSAGDVVITGGSSGSTVLTLTSNALADTPLMVFQRTGGAVAGKLAYEDTNTAISFGTTTAHELKFLTSNTERAQIDSSGNFLLNGTNATGKLVVDGDANAYTARFNSSTTTGQAFGARVRAGTNSSDFAVLVENTSATTMFAVRGDGNLGVGTSSPARQVHLHDASGDNNLHITNSTTGSTASDGFSIVSQSSTNDVILNQRETANLLIHTANTERARFDSSGNLLVGKTSAGIATSGIEARNDGLLAASRASAVVANLNRQTSDGSIIDFRKDNVTVGSIGTDGGDMRLGTGITGIIFNDANNAVLPYRTDAEDDGNIDIGLSSFRFKNLHVSNSVKNASGALSVESGGGAQLLLKASAELTFTANASERARIDSSGNLLVGTTSTYSTSKMTLEYSSNTNFGITLRDSGTATTAGHFNFVKGGSVVGTIQSTSSATSYNTSSDQRLKDNIVDAPSASNDIDAIQVRSFDWKADGSHQKYGMVAQELQSVAPEAVSGGATEEDMMGVDYSKLVPMMMKEIQSLRARVAQLEGVN